VARFWTCHWQYRYWRDDINTEYEPVCSSGSNSFLKRGVSLGDAVYIVSLGAGQLYLGGRMVVKQIVSRPEAVRLWNDPNLYDAEEWIVDPDKSGTPLHLHRCLSPSLTRQLRFVSKSGPKEPFFVSDTDLDNQTTRGVRELTPESAALLDRIIEATDRLPRSDQLIMVTEELLRADHLQASGEEFGLPEEIPSGSVYNEGAVRRVDVNRYERDPGARAACIQHYGTDCFICGFSFGAVYGPLAEGFIHVHHLKPLSEIGEEYVVDPIADLRPVCPNCHAFIHLAGQLRSMEEVKQLVATGKRAEPTDEADRRPRS
jgi:hypothetical protein